MGNDDQDALIEVLRPLVERHGRERIEQALRQIAPRKRGPKGPQYSDAELMQEAYHLYETGRFYGDPDSTYKGKRTTHRALRRKGKRTTNGALRRTVEKFCPEHRREAVLRRLWTRFRKKPLLDGIVTEPRPVRGRYDTPDPNL